MSTRVTRSASRKRAKTVQTDEYQVSRLCSLPEDILRRILCSLPIEDAVRTSVLSKRWRFTYRTIPNLVFVYTKFSNYDQGTLINFSKAINRMIALHDDSDIDTFKVKNGAHDNPYHRFNKNWVLFAVNHNVKHFILDVSLSKIQSIPSCLFTCRSLVTLKLKTNMNQLEFPDYTNLPNLKRAKFSYLIFKIRTQNFLSGCPALGSLTFRNCVITNCLRDFCISHPVLKSFEMSSCYGIYSCKIIIRTPNLVNFTYNGAVAMDHRIEEISSNLTATVVFDNFFDPESRSEGSFQGSVLNLFKGLRKAALLMFNPWFIEYLNVWTYGNEIVALSKISFENVKRLFLHLWPAKQHVIKTLALVHLFPNLSYLYIAISVTGFFRGFPDLDCDSLETIGNGKVLNSLRNVTISRFKGQHCEMQIVKYLLENAVELVEMNIVELKKDCEIPDLEIPMENNAKKRAKIIEKLLAFPRANPKVSIKLT